MAHDAIPEGVGRSDTRYCSRRQKIGADLNESDSVGLDLIFGGRRYPQKHILHFVAVIGPLKSALCHGSCAVQHVHIEHTGLILGGRTRCTLLRCVFRTIILEFELDAFTISPLPRSELTGIRGVAGHNPNGVAGVAGIGSSPFPAGLHPDRR